MRKFVVVLMLFALAIGMTVPALAQERPDLITLLSSDADARFITLSTALEVTGIAAELRGEDYFTVFAPTDAAISASLEALGLSINELQNNPEALVEILSYHVVPGRYFFRNLAGGAELETLQGDSLTVALDGGFLTVNGAATVNDIDNVASNGVVHVVDAILIPQSVVDALSGASTEATAEPEATEAAVTDPTPAPTGQAAQRPSILETLAADADGRFITLSAALTFAGVEFPEGEQFTIFAPSEAAITSTLELLGLTIDDLMANPDALSSILNYHVVAGRYFFRDLTRGAELESLQGEPLAVTLIDGVFAVNGTNISDVDNIASNGVIHVIDNVLVPREAVAALAASQVEATPEPTEETPVVEATPEPEATEAPVTETPAGQAVERPNLIDTLAADADGRFTTFVAALQVSGVGETLASDDVYTVLAPTNDAINGTLEFLGLSTDDLMADPAVFSQILSHHIIPGRYFFRNLLGGATLETANGDTVTFGRVAGGLLSVDGAVISDIDNVAGNGVIHVIDSVLLPVGALPSANLRFINLSADAGDLDVFVNGAAQSLGSIGTNSISAWGEYAPNANLSLAFARAGESISDAVLTSNFAVKGDTTTSILLTGSVEAGTLRAVEVSEADDDHDGLARVTFIHAIDGAPAVNVIANGTTAVVELGYPGTLGDNDGAYIVNLPAGNYNISFDADGRSWASDSTDFAADAHYIFALVGTTDSPTVFVQQID